jgi:hypothetical protein
MFKRLVVLTAVALLAALIVVGPAFARHGKHGGGDKTGKNILMLVELDPATWLPVQKGAQGELKYKATSGAELEFHLRGKDLEPGGSYTLIYFPDPWPGNGLICLGSAAANDQGRLKIKGKAVVPALPIESDANYPCGAKLWLVLTADVDCQGKMMTAWHPESYLFQGELISFDGDQPAEPEGPDAQ